MKYIIEDASNGIMIKGDEIVEVYEDVEDNIALNIGRILKDDVMSFMNMESTNKVNVEIKITKA